MLLVFAACGGSRPPSRPAPRAGAAHVPCGHVEVMCLVTILGDVSTRRGPWSGAHVKLIGADSTAVDEALSDPRGVAVFPCVREGVYELRAMGEPSRHPPSEVRRIVAVVRRDTLRLTIRTLWQTGPFKELYR